MFCAKKLSLDCISTKQCSRKLMQFSKIYSTAAQLALARYNNDTPKKNKNSRLQHNYNEFSYLSLVMRKPVFGVSDQVQYKPGCTATEDGYRLEISNLESRGIVLSV